MRSRLLVLLAFLSVIFVSPAQAANQTINIADLDVGVWKPAESKPGEKAPVIIFSHGFHGCSTQSKFLMEAFARDGYFVFAPNHHDATCANGPARWIDRAEVPFGKPDDWTEETFHNRGEDIHRLIDALKNDERYKDRIDWNRLGLAGHSLGGYTVLALGGAWPDWKLSDVKAILALSPYSQPFIRKDTLSDLSAPVMYQGGTRDMGVTPWINKELGAYDLSPTPKYFVEFMRAGHFAWTNMPNAAHDNIELYSLAFMDHYVKGETADPILTESLRGVSSFRYKSELGNNDNANLSVQP